MSAAPLAGQTAVVTGGTKGLGLAIARAMVAAGALVVAASRGGNPNDERIDGIAWDRVDVTDPQSVTGLFERTAHRHGGPHIVVASAGIDHPALIARMRSGDWQAVIDTNLSGTFHTIQAAASLMQPQGTGRIITVSSCMASLPGQGMAAYAASKAGIQALTKVAAQELGPKGILVSGIAPGILDQGMGETVTSNDRLWQRYARHLSLGRPGTVEEVGHLVVFLAGPNAAYLHGATLAIDGGIAPWA